MTKVYRYCAARTKRELLAELAAPKSRDWGTGQVFGGLVVGVAPGQDLPPVPSNITAELERRGGRLDVDVYYKPSHLAAYIVDQGCQPRKMWQFEVDPADIIGYAGRWCGGLTGHQHYLADGIIIRAGANVKNIKKVKI